MRTFSAILVAAGVALGASPAMAEITTCPQFTQNHTNVLCLDKDPKFDKRMDGTGYIYCSTADDGTPNSEIQVDRYKKESGSSRWKGSCETDCTNYPMEWPLLGTLPQVTAGLCPSS